MAHHSHQMSFELRSPAENSRPFETLNTTTNLQNNKLLNSGGLFPPEYQNKNQTSAQVIKNMSARDGGFNYSEGHSAHHISESVHSTP